MHFYSKKNISSALILKIYSMHFNNNKKRKDIVMHF